MIKVCMLVPDFDRTGGYERQAFSLSRDLKRRGVGVFILTNKTRGDLAACEERDGIPVYRPLPSPGKSPFYRFAIFWALLEFLVRHRKEYDLIHAHALTHIGMMSVIIGKILGKKTLIKIATEGDLTKLVNSPRLKYRTLVRLLRYADCCISLSGNITSELSSAGVPRSKIFSTLNGVDTELFKPGVPEDLSKIKESISLPDKAIVTFVGRFVYRKGVDLLLEAWQRVMEEHPCAQLVLLGFGEEEIRLKELAARLDIDSSVSFKGETGNVAGYLRASDLFVIPSRWEGNPNTLLEASACGLPIVATSIGGIVEVVRDGENGLLVPPDDVEGLADKILLLLNDEGYRTRLGKNARAGAVTRFSFDKIGRRYVERYRSLVGDVG